MNDDTMLGRGATAAFATRKPCKHGSLICFECEPIKEPTMTTKTDALIRAIEYLGAVEVAPGKYAFDDVGSDGSHQWMLTRERNLEAFGIALSQGIDPSDLCDTPEGCKHPLCLACVDSDDLRKPEINMVYLPSWWTPERRYATKSKTGNVEGVFSALPEHFVGDEVYGFTADLETGEEVPA